MEILVIRPEVGSGGPLRAVTGVPIMPTTPSFVKEHQELLLMLMEHYRHPGAAFNSPP